MRENSSRYFRNENCKYFPCHKTDNPDDFNCLFCYCPLYPLGDRCGGDFEYVGKKGDIKSCVNCIKPHSYDYYDTIMARLEEECGK